MMDNRRRYVEERERRWSMAQEGEEEACRAVAEQIQNVAGPPTSYQRYDVQWFAVFPPDTVSWVRGCSDYLLSLAGGYLYAEIKIKAQRYEKTMRGGTTRRGSVVAAYGCESFYLDVTPVYQNMCAFTQNAQIREDSFLLFFVSDDYTSIMAISLAEVRSLVEHGWKGQPLSVFEEGYGMPAYLIPVDACHTINAASSAWLTTCCSPTYAIPRRT